MERPANAGLIEGHYTGVPGTHATVWPMTVMDSTPGINIPMSRFPASGWGAVFIEDIPTVLPNHNGFFDGAYGNSLMFGRTRVDGCYPDAGALTPAETAGIDQKFDDGKPGSGVIRTYNTLWSACPDSDDPMTAKYTVAPDDDSPMCALIFVGVL